MSQGARPRKRCALVFSNSHAPKPPPNSEGTLSQSQRERVLTTSPRRFQAALTVPGHTATVFVVLANTGGSPSQISVGKVRIDPPPAIEFTHPAASATPQARKT